MVCNRERRSEDQVIGASFTLAPTCEKFLDRNSAALGGTMISRILMASLILGTLVENAEARNTKYDLPVAGVIQNSDYQSQLGSDVVFYFADQKTPKVEQTLGEYVTNKKTNSFNKSDESACQWAFLSALLELRDRAKEEGGNAVIDIISFYQKNPFSSQTEYECHAGGVIAGVALKGTVAKLAK